MRDFIAYVEHEGGLYQRPRLRVKARLAPIRLHGRWVDDEALLHSAHSSTLRRRYSTWNSPKNARKAVTHHGSLWFREQFHRFLNG
jgi:hypothetical protein